MASFSRPGWVARRAVEMRKALVISGNLVGIFIAIVKDTEVRGKVPVVAERPPVHLIPWM